MRRLVQQAVRCDWSGVSVLASACELAVPVDGDAERHLVVVVYVCAVLQQRLNDVNIAAPAASC